jgi:phospholipase/carboxylesterase
MSYALALGPKRPQPAGLLAFSGFLPAFEGFALHLENRSGLPVAIGHGTYDSVIGVEWGRQARDRLSAAGASVIYKESPMDHGIDPYFLRELVPFVTRVTTAGDVNARGSVTQKDETTR